MKIKINIIIHATEDIKKILNAIFIFFNIYENEFLTQTVKGHFENPIIIAKTEITKKRADIFVKKLFTMIPKTDIDELNKNLEQRIKKSTLYIRLKKQDFVNGVIRLNGNDAINIKIKNARYTKKNSYMKIIKELMSIDHDNSLNMGMKSPLQSEHR